MRRLLLTTVFVVVPLLMAPGTAAVAAGTASPGGGLREVTAAV